MNGKDFGTGKRKRVDRGGDRTRNRKGEGEGDEDRRGESQRGKRGRIEADFE